jgi:hypothetical protein
MIKFQHRLFTDYLLENLLESLHECGYLVIHDLLKAFEDIFNNYNPCAIDKFFKFRLLIRPEITPIEEYFKRIFLMYDWIGRYKKRKYLHSHLSISVLLKNVQPACKPVIFLGFPVSRTFLQIKEQQEQERDR